MPIIALLDAADGFDEVNVRNYEPVGEFDCIEIRPLAGLTGLENLATETEPFQSQGQTVIFVARDGKSAGMISVADPIKASTPDPIRSLDQLGLRIVMLPATMSTPPAVSPRSSAWTK